MADEIQMIHGYLDSVDNNDLNDNSVLLDSDVGIGKTATVWTSKKLDIEILKTWLSQNLSFLGGNYVNVHNQSIPTINTEQNVEFDNAVYNNGVSRIGNTDFQVLQNGFYRIDVQLQVVRTTGGSNQHVDVWLEFNGVKVINSNRHLIVVSNSGHVLLNLFHTIRFTDFADDVLRVKWAVSSTDISLIYDAATSLHPANPSSSILISKL